MLLLAFYNSNRSSCGSAVQCENFWRKRHFSMWREANGILLIEKFSATLQILLLLRSTSLLVQLSDVNAFKLRYLEFGNSRTHTLETLHFLSCKFMTSTPFPLDHYHIICTGIYQMPSHAFSLKISVQCYPSPFGRNFPSETFEIQMTSALALCVSKCYWLSGASTMLIDAAWLPDSGSLQNRCFRQPSRKMVS